MAGGCAQHLTMQAPSAIELQPGRWIDSRANEFTASTQEDTTVAFDGDGNAIVAWDSRRQQNGQYGVFGRLLNAAGAPLTGEVELNQFTHNSQSDPAVAWGGGETWIAWSSVGQDRVGAAIVARRFDARLRPLSDEIVVNDPFAGHQSDPALAVSERGDAMIVWMAVENPRDGARVQGRVFDRDGSPRSEVFEIEPPHGAADSLPAIAASRDSFVVTWSRRHAQGNDTGSSVLAVRLNSAGAFSSPCIDITAGEAFAHSENVEPAIAADAHGGFVVVWHHATPGEVNHRVAVARFDHTDRLVHSPCFATEVEAGWVSGAAVALSREGDALVCWNQWNVDGDVLGIAAHWYRASGEPGGERFLISSATKGHQSLAIASNAARLACNQHGQIAVAWSGDAGLDDDSAANVSMFLPVSVAVAPATAEALAQADALRTTVAPIPPVFDPNWKPLPPPEDPGDGATGSFMGINFTGWTPPDPEIAVGPDHLVAMTNGAIAYFDKNGTLLFQDEIEDSFGFWGAQGATGFVFDPECLYDPHSGRFFAMACERASNGQSFYLLAVSDDSNPVGAWHKYRIHSPVDNDIDSPNMAVDANVVYLTADFFGPDKYGIVMIEKAPILSGGAINQRTMTITGSGDQSMGIPIIYDATAPAGYLIQSSEGTGNGLTFSEVRFHAIRNQLTTPTRVAIDVAVPTYSYPNQPPQMGTSNRPFLFEPRFWSCMYVGGSMWAIHHVNGSRARARWYEFEMNGWPDSGQDPSLRQSGELDYGGTIHTFFPSIAADEDGNAAFVFARSSPSEFISMCGTYRLASDPLGTTRPMFFIKQSTVPYTGAGRWGDYSHIERDPSSTAFSTFWGMHEWTDVSNSWRTWIARIDVVPDIAILADLTVQFGTLVSGGLPELMESDDATVRVRSQLGFSSSEPNLVELRIGATTDNLAAESINLSIESRLNHPGGSARLRLRNWATNSFQFVHQYPIGSTEGIEQVNNIDATDRIRQTDGRIWLSIRHSVLVTFTAQGFNSFTDHVVISPQ